MPAQDNFVPWIVADIRACFLGHPETSTHPSIEGITDQDASGDPENQGYFVDPEKPTVAAMMWKWVLPHTRHFAGADPTYNNILIEGMTVISAHETQESSQYTRYIDWVNILAQMGMLPGKQVVGHANRSPTVQEVLQEYGNR